MREFTHRREPGLAFCLELLLADTVRVTVNKSTVVVSLDDFEVSLVAAARQEQAVRAYSIDRSSENPTTDKFNAYYMPASKVYLLAVTQGSIEDVIEYAPLEFDKLLSLCWQVFS